MAAITWSPPARHRPATRHLRVVPGGGAGASADRPRRLPAEVYRRRRLLAAAVLVVLLASVALLAGALLPGPPATGRPAAPPVAGARAHVVQPGDTLWSIARSLQPTGDVRPLVDRLAESHGGAALAVGQRVVLSGEW